MFDELKKSMRDAFGTTVDDLILESFINDDVRMIMMESDEAIEEACKKSCGKKSCKEGQDVDSTNVNMRETGPASPGCNDCRGKRAVEEGQDVDSTNRNIKETGSASPDKCPVGEALDVFDEDFEEVAEAFVDFEYEITMEAKFKPERHRMHIAKITDKVNKKLTKLKTEKQRVKLLRYLEDTLILMDQIKQEFPKEEKGVGSRAIKQLIVKVKRAKLPTVEGVEYILEGDVDSTNKEIKDAGSASPDEGPLEDDIDRLLGEIPEDEDVEYDTAFVESLIDDLPEYEL